ncbi:hypothetical protein [Nitrospira moscoviensis]|uniref:Uncharacterized protein n=1 Tax=Nitrospira moscoviensis TaxID=42253 RepID=A0A0K2GGY7_NITMO|nr:hypothetical protein [Nitrospira moscoviensis]ALA60201.1 hypothetical protein NITMOv2_3811 [Nitrospira moscoviensis]
MKLPSKSTIQFTHGADGSVQMEGRADVSLLKVQKPQGYTPFLWMDQLSLPRFQEDWEWAAHPKGLSRRHLRFILADESPLRTPGQRTYDPSKILVQYPPDYYALTLSHTGFIIGFTQPEALIPSERREDWLALGIRIPETTVGQCLIFKAVLYESPLADAAWRGIERGILTHSCAVLADFDPDQNMPGTLREVAIGPSEEVGCSGAKILQHWEA